jgi:hypothetical protein
MAWNCRITWTGVQCIFNRSRLLLLPFVLSPLACFPSELIWNYGSYTFGRTPWMGDQPSRKAATYTGQHKHRRNAQRDIRVSSGVRTHDPCVWAGEDISCLRLRGHCTRLEGRCVYKIGKCSKERWFSDQNNLHMNEGGYCHIHRLHTWTWSVILKIKLA